MKKQLLIHLILVLVLGLGMGGRKVLAQTSPPQEIKYDAYVDVPIQGRLLYTSGAAVNGPGPMILRLYSAASGGSIYCEDSHAVTVTNGLFSTSIHCQRSIFDGRDLYLGVTAGSGEPEMTPRQKLQPVPYAVSFLPGAFVQDAAGTGAVLALAGSNPGLPGVFYVMNGDAQGIAAWLDNSSASDATLTVRNLNSSGPLVKGFSGSDADYDFQIGQSGSIQSSAPSYLTFPGSDIHITGSSCGILTYLNDGSVQISTTSAPCVVYALLSMELPLQLYGTNVQIDSFTFYMYTNFSTAYIDNVFIYLQNTTYNTPFIMAESTGDYSAPGIFTNFTINPTAHDILSPSSGPVTMKFDCVLTNSGNVIILRSVRVGLSHIEPVP